MAVQRVPHLQQEAREVCVMSTKKMWIIWYLIIAAYCVALLTLPFVLT